MSDSTTDDPRSNLEQVTEARADAVEAGEGGNSESPLEPSGIPDGVGGTAGETKNQDKAAQ